MARAADGDGTLLPPPRPGVVHKGKQSHAPSPTLPPSPPPPAAERDDLDDCREDGPCLPCDPAEARLPYCTSGYKQPLACPARNATLLPSDTFRACAEAQGDPGGLLAFFLANLFLLLAAAAAIRWRRRVQLGERGPPPAGDVLRALWRGRL